jgi:hypothetical protein
MRRAFKTNHFQPSFPESYVQRKISRQSRESTAWNFWPLKFEKTPLKTSPNPKLDIRGFYPSPIFWPRFISPFPRSGFKPMGEYHALQSR